MNRIDSNGEGTAFARSAGLPSHMGKSTAELKTKVPECVKDEFVRLAHSMGLNESELLRSIVLIRLYGIEGTARMHSDQLRLAAGLSPEPAPTGAEA